MSATCQNGEMYKIVNGRNGEPYEIGAAERAPACARGATHITATSRLLLCPRHAAGYDMANRLIACSPCETLHDGNRRIILGYLIDAEDVPVHMRCRRSACAKRWPAAAAKGF